MTRLTYEEVLPYSPPPWCCFFLRRRDVHQHEPIFFSFGKGKSLIDVISSHPTPLLNLLSACGDV
jgi:hypothetical protein